MCVAINPACIKNIKKLKEAVGSLYNLPKVLLTHDASDSPITLHIVIIAGNHHFYAAKEVFKMYNAQIAWVESELASYYINKEKGPSNVIKEEEEDIKKLCVKWDQLAWWMAEIYDEGKLFCFVD